MNLDLAFAANNSGNLRIAYGEYEDILSVLDGGLGPAPEVEVEDSKDSEDAENKDGVEGEGHRITLSPDGSVIVDVILIGVWKYVSPLTTRWMPRPDIPYFAASTSKRCLLPLCPGR